MLGIILVIIFVVIAVFDYLIILGANINKTDEEREEDKLEEMRYLNEKMKSKHKIGIKNK